MDVQETEVQTDRILTIPNVLSFARLLGVPLFLWLILGPHADGWAIVLLTISGITDWLDGKIARATGQISRLGQLLDPLADRLYIAATLQAPPANMCVLYEDPNMHPLVKRLIKEA